MARRTKAAKAEDGQEAAIAKEEASDTEAAKEEKEELDKSVYIFIDEAEKEYLIQFCSNVIVG